MLGGQDILYHNVATETDHTVVADKQNMANNLLILSYYYLFQKKKREDAIDQESPS